MVFRKIFKNNRRESISGRIDDDDEGSIVISYDDRYDVLVTSALKNCDYDAAFTTSSSPIITTATAAARSNNTANNNSDNEDERQMDNDDDDDDAGWDTTIHVNENKYKATTTNSPSTSTTYSSWLTSCLNCV